MAWTSPTTWVTGNVVTAAQLNTHLRDNLKYLKGQAGSIYLEDKVGIKNSSPLGNLDVGSNSEIYFSPTDPNTINSAGGTNTDAGDIWINYRGYNDGFTRFRTFRVGNGKGAQIAIFDGATGRVGMGVTSPNGPMHVQGTLGKWLYYEFDGLAGAAQTVLAASSASYAQAGWSIVRSSSMPGSGSQAQVSQLNANSLASATIFTANAGADQVQLQTASGGYTITRTAGTMTYKVAIFLMVM